MKALIYKQQDEINSLKTRLDAREAVHVAPPALLQQLRDEIDQIKLKLADGDPVARMESRNALSLVNNLESHNRRWAVRILGLPAPRRPETTEEAKYVAVDFFNDTLKVDFDYEEIDCSHRVGKIVANKQTLLVRLFSREQVDTILSKRKNLKGSTFVIFEDATMANRLLVNALNRMDVVENAWITNGTVWAKKAGGTKFKVTIHDNLDTLIPNQ
jgi:hypothetical protein